jgi:hypothetical protein
VGRTLHRRRWNARSLDAADIKLATLLTSVIKAGGSALIKLS